MKKLLFSAMFVTAFFIYKESHAQVRFNINLNVGARPAWGVPGNYAGDYYYLPEIDSYYDIPTRQFIYFDGRTWIYAANLPYMYRDYDLYRGYKVVVNEPRPYLRCDFYRDRYRSYYDTYRTRVEIGPRYDNDRYNRGRWEDHDNGRRGWYERNDRDRDDRDNRGGDRDDRNNRGRDHDDRGRRGRG